MGLPDFNGGTIEIFQNRKRGPIHRINKDIVNLFLDIEIERLERIELVVNSFRDQDM